MTASRLHATVGTVVIGALAGGMLAMAPQASADPAGDDLVISEVYGGGGNSGATWTNDFIELYNPTDVAISVDGWSVQYRSANNTGTGVTTLSGSVAAGGRYLVQEAAGAGGSDALPAPDATGGLAMGGGSGTVLLSDGTAPVTLVSGDNASTPGVVDLVGYGTSSTFETAATGTALTSAQSASRAVDGADTDDNATDFTIGAPTPTNAAGETEPPTDPGGGPVDATIAEVQGTGDTSPLEDQKVTTEGVVTAVYDTGGFNGFYLQDPAGDPADTASDGVFVYGSTATAADVAEGDSVSVTGAVSEYKAPSDTGTTLTEITADEVTELGTPLPAVTALDVPWADLDTDAEKEAHEGELLDLAGDPFTVSDNYDANFYGEFLLAAGTEQLITPTEVEDAQAGDVEGVEAANDAKRIALDDGASINFNNSANKGTPLSWLTPDNPVRIGSQVAFQQPVVLDYRNSTWKVQPTAQVTGDGANVATFSDTRGDNQGPQDVGGGLKLATFNVLNYFPTTGADFEAAGGTCSEYPDRAGNPIAVNECEGVGPRGAANDENLARQQTKIVKAINKLDASIVSLEEIENSVALGVSTAGDLGLDRDDALRTLVKALDAQAGAGTWRFVPSPSAEDLPAVADQDVIRTAFIYKPAAVETVGSSKVLTDAPAFDNAREPLAQGFKPDGGEDADAFAVIVNHFKSKGSGTDDGTGQGNANPDRVAQAEALTTFAGDFSTELGGSGAVFLTGDFNAYSQEDPVQVIEDGGYTELNGALNDGESTYSFDGMAGSLDHVFANDAGLALVTGVDVWQINAQEQVGFEYSRYNYNATILYDESVFRASDHNPEIVGLDLEPGLVPSTTTAKASQQKVVVKKTRLRVNVRVRAAGAPAAGKVSVTAAGRTYSGRLDAQGRVTITLEPFPKTGVKVVKIKYLGNATTAPSSAKLTVKVVR